MQVEVDVYPRGRADLLFPASCDEEELKQVGLFFVGHSEQPIEVGFGICPDERLGVLYPVCLEHRPRQGVFGEESL